MGLQKKINKAKKNDYKSAMYLDFRQGATYEQMEAYQKAPYVETPAEVRFRYEFNFGRGWVRIESWQRSTLVEILRASRSLPSAYKAKAILI